MRCRKGSWPAASLFSVCLRSLVKQDSCGDVIPPIILQLTPASCTGKGSDPAALSALEASPVHPRALTADQSCLPLCCEGRAPAAWTLHCFLFSWRTSTCNNFGKSLTDKPTPSSDVYIYIYFLNVVICCQYACFDLPQFGITSNNIISQARHFH